MGVFFLSGFIVGAGHVEKSLAFGGWKRLEATLRRFAPRTDIPEKRTMRLTAGRQIPASVMSAALKTNMATRAFHKPAIDNTRCRTALCYRGIRRF
jgi:hypothetical protein